MKFAFFKSTIVLGTLLFFANNRFVVAASSQADLGGGGDDHGADIVGGVPATAGDFFVPGYATFLIKDSGNGGCCGAHLIAPGLLLTAAHCKPCIATYLGSIFGSVSIGGLRRDTSDGELKSIDGFWIHPDYKFQIAQNPVNDIMIVRLATRTTKQIATWNTDSTNPAVGETIQLVGFGWTVPEDANSLPATLQKGQVTIAEPNTCTNSSVINFCAAGGNGVGTCKGDSGSPVFDLQTRQILGLVSFGPPVCTDGPGKGFTRVSAFNDWIVATACAMTRQQDPKPAFCLAPPPTPNDNDDSAPPTKAPSPSVVKDPRTGKECPFSGDFADFLCLLWLIWTWFLSLFGL